MSHRTIRFLSYCIWFSSIVSDFMGLFHFHLSLPLAHTHTHNLHMACQCMRVCVNLLITCKLSQTIAIAIISNNITMPPKMPRQSLVACNTLSKTNAIACSVAARRQLLLAERRRLAMSDHFVIVVGAALLGSEQALHERSAYLHHQFDPLLI